MCQVLTFLKLFTIILVVLVIEGGADDRRDYDIGDNLLMILSKPKTQKLFQYVLPKPGAGWLVSCAAGRGLCVSSNACPWDRMLSDVDDDCLYGDFPSCCHVTPARMPRDMFEAYD